MSRRTTGAELGPHRGYRHTIKVRVELAAPAELNCERIAAALVAKGRLTGLEFIELPRQDAPDELEAVVAMSGKTPDDAKDHLDGLLFLALFEQGNVEVQRIIVTDTGVDRE